MSDKEPKYLSRAWIAQKMNEAFEQAGFDSPEYDAADIREMERRNELPDTFEGGSGSNVIHYPDDVGFHRTNVLSRPPREDEDDEE